MIDSETRRYIDDLLAGRTNAAGTFSLATAGTSTTVSRRGVSSSSVILLMPYSANTGYADISRVVPAKDSFTITHTASGSTRTWRYEVRTGVNS